MKATLAVRQRGPGLARAGLLLAALVFKFWLIAPMQIMDEIGDPTCYMVQILWNAGDYYGPGIGFVGRLFLACGIPFRIGIEVLYLVASLLVVRAFFTWPTRSWLALGLYLFVVFNPAVEELLSHLMSDQIWLVEIMAGLSLLVFSVAEGGRKGWFLAALAAFCVGLAVVTRTTFQPLLAAFLIWAVLAIGLAWWKQRSCDGRLIGSFLICLYGMGLIYYGVLYSNLAQRGYFGLSVFDCREYQKLYMTLQSVGPPDGARYFPIDDARLELVRRAGPQSAWLVDRLEHDVYYRRVSLAHYGVPGLGLAWFHNALFDDIDGVRDPRRTVALFQEVENEIAAAAREGRLPVRTILPLPDARLGVLLPALPDAIRNTNRSIVFEPPQYAWYSTRFHGHSFDDPYFSHALLRGVVTPSPVREKIGRVLCAIYAPIYRWLLDLLILTIIAFLFAMARSWQKIKVCSADFLVRQLFLVVCVMMYFWYALFDASGLLVVPRYMVFNNVVLPVLVLYYLGEAWRMWRRPPDVLCTVAF